MVMIRTASLLISALALAAPASARPVSYPGGWTVIQANNGDMSSALVHYSPSAHDSFGVYVERDWSEDMQFTGLQYTRLVKRWNAPQAQANLYAMLGAGAADAFGPGDAEAGGFAGIMADWETRRWFIGYEGRLTDYGSGPTARQSAHLGIAPYIGDAGDLHTWIMLDVSHKPEADIPVTVTPMLRFFQGVQMVEIGYTLEEDEYMLNWIYRF